MIIGRGFGRGDGSRFSTPYRGRGRGRGGRPPQFMNGPPPQARPRAAIAGDSDPRAAPGYRVYESVGQWQHETRHQPSSQSHRGQHHQHSTTGYRSDVSTTHGSGSGPSNGNSLSSVVAAVGQVGLQSSEVGEVDYDPAAPPAPHPAILPTSVPQPTTMQVQEGDPKKSKARQLMSRVDVVPVDALLRPTAQTTASDSVIPGLPSLGPGSGIGDIIMPSTAASRVPSSKAIPRVAVAPITTPAYTSMDTSSDELASTGHQQVGVVRRGIKRKLDIVKQATMRDDKDSDTTSMPPPAPKKPKRAEKQEEKVAIVPDVVVSSVPAADLEHGEEGLSLMSVIGGDDD